MTAHDPKHFISPPPFFLLDCYSHVDVDGPVEVEVDRPMVVEVVAVVAVRMHVTVGSNNRCNAQLIVVANPMIGLNQLQ